MVGLDRAGFDDVGIDRSLGQETDSVQLAGFFLEYADKLGADDFPFLLRVGYAGQLIKETVCGVDIDQIGIQLVTKDTDNLLGFSFAEESMIDMDRNQLTADRFDQQSSDDGGIDTARKGQ